MDITTQKRNAKIFIKNWKNRGHEKQDSQSFWLQLLRDVLGVDEPEQFIKFEEKVKLSHDSFIDAYIEQTHVLIEQKGSDKDLDKPIKQSDGSVLTPFQQAQRYSAALPYSERPRWIVTCNFREFRVYDMENPNSEPTKIETKDLANDYYQLDFLVDKFNQHLEKEKRVSLNAGELVGKIYDELLKQYPDPSNEHTQKSINQLCVRIVFCLYAEDAGIFGRKNMFHDYLEGFEPHQIRQALIRLFNVLDTKEEDRDSYLADDYPKLAQFPYVNGGMFSDKNVEIPKFTQDLKDLLLRKASDKFDWSQISPTIFGAVFESTLNPETRRKGGMHYTSVANIHKVIDPLFLNDLKDELNKIKQYKQPSILKQKAQEFQKKLANLTFFDPACGSGNFLTETYLSLRKLENDAIQLQLGIDTNKNKNNLMRQSIQNFYGNNSSDSTVTNAQLDVNNLIKVSIQNFFGIEINDFAVSVAKTALWIAESQMFDETKAMIYSNSPFLPLKTYTHIREGNALTMDWNKVISNFGCDYIISNPPFAGYSLQDKQQKKDLKSVLTDINNRAIKDAGKLDYVTGWYYKAAKYIQNTNIKVCFVSTNSITQGDQIYPVWYPLLNSFKLHINFAYTTFVWNNEAKHKAHVHVVIISFSLINDKKKIIYKNNGFEIVNHINPYLRGDESDIMAESHSKPLCGQPAMTTGNRPADGGYLLIKENEIDNFLRKEPRAKKWIKRFTGSNEYIKGKKRYCLWLVDSTPKERRSMPLVRDRIRKCRIDREKGAADRKKLAATPWLFREQLNPKTFLIVPATSSERREYVPMGFLNSDYIASNSAIIIPNADLYDFGILNSSVHMIWMRAVAGRLEMRYRYSKNVVYDDFPWPKVSIANKQKIAKTAQGILDARKLYPDSSLADLYDPDNMPIELRKAHHANDKIVMHVYGIKESESEKDIRKLLFKMYKRINENEKE